MEVIQAVLQFLDSKMETPQMYGAFHLSFFAASFVAAFILCLLWRKGIIKNVQKVVFITAVIVLILEIYKQINFSFGYQDGITFDYQWYAFPWQFCSTPLYVGLLAGLSRGRIHDHLCAYLSTFALFAGLAVMFYPATVFTDTVGINIQTMICHGSMVTVAIFLYYTGHVKAEHGTLLKAIPVFACAVSIAMILNELAHFTGLLETDTFNMFFISPYCDPQLPVYSWIQGIVPFPFCLLFYIFGFTAAAWIMLLIPMGIKRLSETDFDADYAEEDAAKVAAGEAQIKASAANASVTDGEVLDK